MRRFSYAVSTLAVATAVLSGCSAQGQTSTTIHKTTTTVYGDGAGTTAPAPSNASIGALAPAWSLPLSTGGTLNSASFSGKPVYLNFFATWCPPCNDEAPSVDKLAQKYKSTGLVVVGVDEAENASKAQYFRTEHHLSYPAVVDGGVLRDAYAVNGLPVHAFIGRDGKLEKLVVGQMEPADIDATLKKITSSSTHRTSP